MIRLKVLLVWLACLVALPAGAETRTLLHDGRTRSYIVEFPAGTAPAPALIVLHGGGGSARQVRRQAENTLAAEGWVVVYPDAERRVWSDPRRVLPGAAAPGADDPGFLRALVGALVAEGRVDPARVHMAGISNGGALAHLVLCEAPELVAGAVIAIMTLPEGLDCPADGPPRPLLLMLGTADGLVPYGGGPVAFRNHVRGHVRSAEETYALYAARNRCGAPVDRMLPDADPGDGVRVRVREWQGCAAPLVALIAEGGGHGWPGRAGRLRRIDPAPVPMDYSATAEMEAFLRAIDRAIDRR